VKKKWEGESKPNTGQEKEPSRGRMPEGSLEIFAGRNRMRGGKKKEGRGNEGERGDGRGGEKRKIQRVGGK